MLWFGVAVSGPGQLAVIESTMNFASYQSVLDEDICQVEAEPEIDLPT